MSQLPDDMVCDGPGDELPAQLLENIAERANWWLKESRQARWWAIAFSVMGTVSLGLSMVWANRTDTTMIWGMGALSLWVSNGFFRDSIKSGQEHRMAMMDIRFRAIEWRAIKRKVELPKGIG